MQLADHITQDRAGQIISSLQHKADIILNDLIENPIEGTDSKRWQYVKNRYKTNIKSLTHSEQNVQKQFAYTVNKGDTIKLCMKDEKGELDEDVLLYVLLHEITHIYDTKYQTSHDQYFWIVFSKLIGRAIDLNVLDDSIFNKTHERCNTPVIKPIDYQLILNYQTQPIPSR